MSSPITPTSPASTWAVQSLLFDDQSVVTWVGSDGAIWPVSGGMAPIPPQEGVELLDIKGMHGAFAHVMQQGAHQDGGDWLDTTYDKSELDMTLSFLGATPAGRRRVFREFLAGWEPKKQGRLCWFTSQLGEWWLPLRYFQEPRDVIAMGDRPSLTMAWAAQADFPFWTSFDSVSPRMLAITPTTLADPTGVGAPNFLPQWNRGDQDGWPRYLLQGPGVFTIGDNGGPRRITLPLSAGQVARITTLPMRRTVTELNTNTNLYPKLTGRFSTPVPAGQVVQVPVTVTGAQVGVTSAMASLTPWRRWPE